MSHLGLTAALAPNHPISGSCAEREHKEVPGKCGATRGPLLSLLRTQVGPARSFLWWDLMWKTRSEVRRKDRLHLAHQFPSDRPREAGA